MSFFKLKLSFLSSYLKKVHSEYLIFNMFNEKFKHVFSKNKIKIAPWQHFLAPAYRLKLKRHRRRLACPKKSAVAQTSTWAESTSISDYDHKRLHHEIYGTPVATFVRLNSKNKWKIHWNRIFRLVYFIARWKHYILTV